MTDFQVRDVVDAVLSLGNGLNGRVDGVDLVKARGLAAAVVKYEAVALSFDTIAGQKSGRGVCDFCRVSGHFWHKSPVSPLQSPDWPR